MLGQYYSPYKPINISFPTGNGKSFRVENQFPWIEFNESLICTFYFNCRVFPSTIVEQCFVMECFKCM